MKDRWINRLICRIFGHDLYVAKTFSPDTVQVRCKMCGQRFDSDGKFKEPDEE